jgi:RimJ/RimL family protein N-acetyltransferase
VAPKVEVAIQRSLLFRGGTQLTPPRLKQGTIELRPVETEDAEFILELRTDAELARYLSPTDRSINNQREWIEKYKKREADGTEFYFLILNESAPCGTIRLYDFRGNSFCWGSWILRKGTPTNVSIVSLFLLLDYAFNALNFIRTHFDVRKDNRGPKAFYLRLGARPVREDEKNLYLELTREDYERVKPRFARYTRQ